MKIKERAGVRVSNLTTKPKFKVTTILYYVFVLTVWSKITLQLLPITTMLTYDLSLE